MPTRGTPDMLDFVYQALPSRVLFGYGTLDRLP